METTIIKTVKGATMEVIFDDCKAFSVRHFKALDLESEESYNPENNYKYEITIRHAENKGANLLFESERFAVENLRSILKKYEVESKEDFFKCIVTSLEAGAKQMAKDMLNELNTPQLKQDFKEWFEVAAYRERPNTAEAYSEFIAAANAPISEEESNKIERLENELNFDLVEYLEVHFEMVQHVLNTEDRDGTEAKYIQDTEGTGGKYELAKSLTDDFMELHGGKVWGIDADFFDTLQEFLQNREKQFTANIEKTFGEEIADNLGGVKRFFIFGSEVCQKLIQGEELTAEDSSNFDLLAYTEGETSPTELLNAFSGWGDYQEITAEQYTKFQTL